MQPHRNIPRGKTLSIKPCSSNRSRQRDRGNGRQPALESPRSQTAAREHRPTAPTTANLVRWAAHDKCQPSAFWRWAGCRADATGRHISATGAEAERLSGWLGEWMGAEIPVENERPARGGRRLLAVGKPPVVGGGAAIARRSWLPRRGRSACRCRFRIWHGVRIESSSGRQSRSMWEAPS